MKASAAHTAGLHETVAVDLHDVFWVDTALEVDTVTIRADQETAEPLTHERDNTHVRVGGQDPISATVHSIRILGATCLGRHILSLSSFDLGLSGLWGRRVRAERRVKSSRPANLPKLR